MHGHIYALGTHYNQWDDPQNTHITCVTKACEYVPLMCDASLKISSHETLSLVKKKSIHKNGLIHFMFITKLKIQSENI